jgi:KaiC/GvpD/RAD55 family RecA-like ATPase
MSQFSPIQKKKNKMTLYYTADEAKAFEASLREIHFHSNFGWPNSHNGFRRGNMHLLIAGTGAGKSTLTRAIVSDLVLHKNNDSTIAVWLSEETVDEYKALFSLGKSSNGKLLSTNANSELEITDLGELMFFEWLHFVSPDIFIYDNITTSHFYVDKTPPEQAKFARKLKRTLKELNCAGIIIAHGDSQQTQQKSPLLDINNIRGSKTICNLAEFAYTFQMFSSEAAKATFLRIVKSRSQRVIHDTYLLKYDSSSMSYVGDVAVPFSELKKANDERNRF